MTQDLVVLVADIQQEISLDSRNDLLHRPYLSNWPTR